MVLYRPTSCGIGQDGGLYGVGPVISVLTGPEDDGLSPDFQSTRMAVRFRMPQRPALRSMVGPEGTSRRQQFDRFFARGCGDPNENQPQPGRQPLHRAAVEIVKWDSSTK